MRKRNLELLKKFFLLALCFTSLGLFAQNKMSKPLVQVTKVVGQDVEYTLQIIDQKVDLSNVIKEFLSKEGIRSCVVDEKSRSLRVLADKEIDASMIVDVARVAGCQETYKAYRLTQKQQSIKEERVEEK